MLFAALMASSFSFGQDDCSIEQINSIIANKTFGNADVPPIRSSGSYPTGKDAILFLPDSASNQLGVVYVRMPSKIDSIEQLTLYFHDEKLIKAEVTANGQKEVSVLYFDKGRSFASSAKAPALVSADRILKIAEEYTEYYKGSTH